MSNIAILGFSGGLDTTVCVRWLQERDYQPVCLTVDVGQGIDVEAAQARAKMLGVQHRVIDARDDFANYFLAPALKANAMYQGVYPVATALSRPLIGKLMVDVANEYNTKTFAHGCTGKGNDQLRFELAIKSLVPGAEILDPISSQNLSRDAEIAYLTERGIHTEFTPERPFSIDQNLWGRSICAGVLEDAGVEPPEEVFLWTRSLQDAPSKPETIEVSFEEGQPVAINGQLLSFATIVERLNARAGEHGIGRIDHIEDRVVGIKTREVYEAPAAIALINAHRGLEALTLSRSSLEFKHMFEQAYANLVYKGDWYSHHHLELLAYLAMSQRPVSGVVRLRLYKGTCAVVGRESPFSLYVRDLATYTSNSTFDQKLAAGFRHITSIENVVAAQHQLRSIISDERVFELAGGRSHQHSRT